MITVRSSRILLFALLALTAASFGCKRGTKGPNNGTTDAGALDVTSASGPTDTDFRPSGEPTDASSVLKTIYFDYDRDEIRPDQQSALDGNVDYLKQNTDKKIQIVGNCDERGTNEYNFALGDRRAKSVRSYLVEHGIAADRITTTSMGEEQPAVQGSTEEAWAQNRRALFNFAQ